MDSKKIARINELAKKKKTVGLTPEEKVEQARLRERIYRRGIVVAFVTIRKESRL